MINGDKTCDQSCEIVSPVRLKETYAPTQSQNSDDGDEESPVHSHYSSFGDSEFERYCSANSMMGTPSFCSSVGTFQESSELDFVSLGSSGLGDFSNSPESYRLEGEFSRSFRERRLSPSSGSVSISGHKNEDCGRKNSFDGKNAVVEKGVIEINDGFNLYNDINNVNRYAVSSDCGSRLEVTTGMDLSTIMDEELCILGDCGGIVRREVHGDLATVSSSVEAVTVEPSVNISSFEANISGVESNVQAVENCLPALHLLSDEEFERDERGNCSDEEKTSSRFEHSDGDDSMFGYGTDDYQKFEIYNQKNVQIFQEPRGGKGNNILMSSSVAFGSDDWYDFAQETRQLDINSISSDMRLGVTNGKKVLDSPSQADTAFPIGRLQQGEVVIDLSGSRTQVQGALEFLDHSKTLAPTDFLSVVEKKQSKEDILIGNEDTGVLDDLECYLENQIDSGNSTFERNPQSQRLPFKEKLIKESNLREMTQHTTSQDFINDDGNRVSVGQEADGYMLQLDHSFDVIETHSNVVSTETTEVPGVGFLDEERFPVTMDQNYTKRSLQDMPVSFELSQNHHKQVKTDNMELLEFCDELVHEMEEILLDSSVSSQSRFTHSDKPFQAQSPLPSRDGGSTASTSADDDTYPLNRRTHRIDGIEVIGAKQKKGDVSFSERLVGVKEYTVYVIRVQSGNDHWEVERRYRDFCTLHRRLKALFTAEGWVLPSPWSSVEKESRKFFGNVSPDVVRERSSLIQDCLLSILYHQFSSTFPSALIWFLSPQNSLPSSPSSNIHDPQSPLSSSAYTHNKMSFGKTLSLVVETRPYKSMKQILEAQHFICAGCHKHFDDGKTRVLEFVQTLGWGKPRLCEYTGQLFCSTCHTNETAVLPARVLHHWDFSLYPVSQMAKSYLDSIHDKPMLCVSAVNPFLFSKVPALQQVTGVRKSIGVMLPYVRCPFRMSIFRGLASRRYLLESNDFFALRDLVDLSKGAFAALPVIVDTVSRKILEHITEQCLVCCDVGIPCNARQACNDPSALIFPFQEGEVERCRSCKSVFHKLCFGKILNCPCGESLRLDGQKGHKTKSELNSITLDLFGKKSDSNSSMGFISGLFTKGKNEKWGSKDADNVISLGSLPSSSL